MSIYELFYCLFVIFYIIIGNWNQVLSFFYIIRTKYSYDTFLSLLRVKFVYTILKNFLIY